MWGVVDGYIVLFRFTSLTTRRKERLKREFQTVPSSSLHLADKRYDSTAYFSFGGLLMALRGSYRHLAGVVVGENVYLLMRK